MTIVLHRQAEQGTGVTRVGVDGSLELMDAIHTELVGDLRADWDPAWQDRGEHTAYFGEVNPSHNPEMPATLAFWSLCHGLSTLILDGRIRDELLQSREAVEALARSTFACWRPA